MGLCVCKKLCVCNDYVWVTTVTVHRVSPRYLRRIKLIMASLKTNTSRSSDLRLNCLSVCMHGCLSVCVSACVSVCLCLPTPCVCLTLVLNLLSHPLCLSHPCVCLTLVSVSPLCLSHPCSASFLNQHSPLTV